MTLHSPSTISQEQCFKIGHDRLLPNLYELRIRYFDDALYEPEQCRLHSDQDTGWTVRGSNACKGKGFFYFPKQPDGMWGAPSIPFSKSRGSCPEEKRPEHEVTHHLHPGPTSRISGAIPLRPYMP